MNAGVILLMIVGLTIVVMIARYKVFDEQGFETYLLKAKKHYSLRVDRYLPTPWKISLAPEALKFTAVFADGCDYDNIALGHDGEDINKLFGVNYGFDDRWRSVRVGWRADKNLGVIHLYLYYYSHGKRFFEPITDVKLYEEVNFMLWHDVKNKVARLVTTVDESRYVNVAKGIDESWVRFKLFPYFGGNKKAPQDMKILLKYTRFTSDKPSVLSMASFSLANFKLT